MTSGEPTPTDDGQLRTVLLLIAGVAVLVIALVLLFEGGDLFSRDGRAENDTALEPIPAFSATPISGLADGGSGALPEVGGPAPDFTLVDLEGNAVTLSDLRGRPVVLNFWATWCPPCRLEMPELQETQRDYAEQGVVVLTVNQDESAAQVQSFFDEIGLTLQAVLDDDGDVGIAYGAFYLPSTVFINADGDITAFHRGIISRSQMDDYLVQMLPTQS